MYLLYADDAGSVKDTQQNYIVLAGFSVFERQAHWLSLELDKIAARFSSEPRIVELHGCPMRGGRDIWRRVPLADRIQAMKDALMVFANSHQLNRAFGVVVHKAAVSPEDPIEYAFEHLVHRFDRYLGRLHKQQNTQRGIIIFDKMSYENALQGLAGNFKADGHRWGKPQNMAEVPLFLDSRTSRMVQLADLMAYAIFRNYESNDSQYLDIFKHRFDADGGIIHGLHVRHHVTFTPVPMAPWPS